MSFNEILGAVVGGAIILLLILVVVSKVAYGDMSLFSKIGSYVKNFRSG